jgi:hypothetical protein
VGLVVERFFHSPLLGFIVKTTADFFERPQ